MGAARECSTKMSANFYATDTLWYMISKEPSDIDWEWVLKRIMVRPRECAQRGRSGTVLHQICRAENAPTKVVRSAIRAARWTLFCNHENCTPLKWACTNGASLRTIKTILHEIGRIKHEFGCTFVRVRDCSLTNLMSSSGFWSPSFPLGVIEVFMKDFASKYCGLSEFFSSTKDASILSLLSEPESLGSESFMDKLRMLLTTIDTLAAEEEGRVFCLVHSFLYFAGEVLVANERDQRGPTREEEIAGCVRVLNAITERNPGEFQIRDREGNLPIHTVANLVDAARPNQIVETLLAAYPESTRIANGQGQLPLHLFSSHADICSLNLAEAEPQALVTRCKVSGLYPFQLAAISRKENATSVIYSLLRKAPHVLQSYRKEESWMDSPEYKEIQQNKLKIAQMDARHKLEVDKVKAKNESLKRKLDKMVAG